MPIPIEPKVIQSRAPAGQAEEQAAADEHRHGSAPGTGARPLRKGTLNCIGGIAP